MWQIGSSGACVVDWLASFISESRMVLAPDSLDAQLLRLPPTDRARLAQLLLESLDAPEADEADASPVELDRLWQAEAERRLAELRSGMVAGIPAAEVFAAAERRLAR